MSTDATRIAETLGRPPEDGQMLLYVCWGTFSHPAGHPHPCERAYRALKAAGHEPTVIKSFGLRHLPNAIFNRSRGRKRAKQLTGNVMVPVLVTDDGRVLNESKRIADWAERNEPQTTVNQ